MTVKKIALDEQYRIHTANHSSKGDQPKWLQNNLWYKADHMGYEALSEIVISHLLSKSNLEDYVRYEPVVIYTDGKQLIGCASENFKCSHEQIIPFERLHRAYKGVGLSEILAKFSSATERIQYTVDFVEFATEIDNIGRYLTTMLELDAIFLNEDRHTNNLAVIRDEKSLLFRVCPVFDNGLALLSDTNDYPIDEDVYTGISRVKAKPFSDSFNDQLMAAESLYGSPLKLSFSKKDVESELCALEAIYPQITIERVYKILCEQMRKYVAYFN